MEIKCVDDLLSSKQIEEVALGTKDWEASEHVVVVPANPELTTLQHHNTTTHERHGPTDPMQHTHTHTYIIVRPPLGSSLLESDESSSPVTVWH